MKMRAVIWTMCLIAMGIVTIWKISANHSRIDGDILSLIGQESSSNTSSEQLSDINIVRDLLAQDANQAIIMLSHSERDALENTNQELAQKLRAINGTQNVSLPGFETGDAQPLYALYQKHAYGLLSQRDRDALIKGDGKRLFQRALQNLYSPSSLISAQSLKSDPFSLLPDFLSDLGAKIGQSGLVMDGEQFATPILLTLSKDVRSNGQDANWVSQVNDTIATTLAANTGLHIAKTGQIFFAVSEASHARSDVQRIAIIATTGVVIMVIAVFMSALPLVATLLTVGSGLLAGITALVVVFDSIHAIALVFGASLIGISIDYALHYLVLPSSTGTASTRLAQIRPGLRLGLLTTACGFAALAVTPTILLAQISLYSIAGLIAAYATVVLILPVLPCRDVRNQSPVRALYERINHGLLKVRIGAAQRLSILAAAILGLVAMAIYLPANDDIAALGHGDAALINDARIIGQTLGMGGNPQFIRIDGDNVQDRLETAEAVRTALEPFLRDGVVGSLFGLADVIPSINRQRENRDLVASELVDPYGAKLQAALPFKISTDDTPPDFLEPDQGLLASIPGLANLQQGETDIMRINAVQNPDAIRNAIAEIHTARLINPRETITAQFGQYRNWAVLALAASLIAAGILAIIRYGILGGLSVLAAPLIAILLAVIGAYAVGVTINFFAVMALFLVFAIGADYAIFTAESQHHGQQDETRFAVFLSLISSILAFGLLATSSVPVVNAIGTIISIGLTCAWVLSYWMGSAHVPDRNTDNR